MRNALLLSLVLVGAGSVITHGHGAAAQSQPAPAPKPTQTQPAPAPKPTTPAPAGQTPAPKPAQPTAPAGQTPAGQTPGTQPAPRRTTPATTAAARGGMAITITDNGGSTLTGVSVSADGPTARMGESNGSGQINFPGLLAGVYRLRFDGEAVVSFEKEVTIRSGQVLDVDVRLSPGKRTPPPAPAPVAAPPPPAPVAKTGPTGQPQVLSIPKVLESDFVGKNPRRESLLSCSGTTRALMIQVNQPTPERMYADADMVYYVIGGEGTMKLNGKDTKLSLNDFVSVPRGGSHSFERRGGRALVLLSILGGEPCDSAR
jgi:mannose-6-phosphate isomerase-like protein (cupin superfamily)